MNAQYFSHSHIRQITWIDIYNYVAMVCLRKQYNTWTAVHVSIPHHIQCVLYVISVYISIISVYMYIQYIHMYIPTISYCIPIDIPWNPIFLWKSQHFLSSSGLWEERHDIHGRHQDSEHGTNGHQQQVQPLLLLEMTIFKMMKLYG